jgi:hypothetical protein
MSGRSGCGVRTSVTILLVALLVVGSVLGVVLALGYLGGADSLPPVDVLFPTNEYLDGVRSRVSPGDLRGDAVDALSDARYHGQCEWGDGLVDVFVYGPQDGGGVPIGLFSLEVDGELVVQDLGILNPSALGELEDCLPPEFLE